MGQQRPGSTNGRGTGADWLANTIVNMRERREAHVCGNCRNPWTKYGREDCPNAGRTR